MNNGMIKNGMIKNTKGIAWFMVLIFMGVIIVLIFTQAALFSDRLYRIHDIVRDDEAEVAAKSILERGVLESRFNGMGYEKVDGTDEIIDRNGDGTPEVWGKYEIWARAKPTGWRTGFVATPQDANYAACNFGPLCVVPLPGTGTAGGAGTSSTPDMEVCDFTDPSQPWATDLDDDCNWNKLHYGEVVSFPLYYEVDPTNFIASACDADGNGICNPAELGLWTFTLRVRTPDTNGDGTPETLGWADTSDLDGPIVVNWEITGDCDTATLGFPNGDGVADESCWMIGSEAPAFSGLPDSFINADDVNTAVLNEVVTGGSVGKMWTGNTCCNILDFLTTNETDPFGLGLNFEILNPLLTISVVTPLENAVTLGSVPYLEYQIQVDQPISDAKISLSTIAYAQGKRKVYPSYQTGFFSIGGQSLIQFVIQN